MHFVHSGRTTNDLNIAMHSPCGNYLDCKSALCLFLYIYNIFNILCIVLTLVADVYGAESVDERPERRSIFKLAFLLK